jgi:methylmalonyl-CoA epimerase
MQTVATIGKGVAELMDCLRRCAVTKDKNRSAVEKLSLDGPRLDHLGVAVKSIATVRRFYEGLGLAVSHEEIVEYEKVKTAMLPLGESRIELLEATEEDSTIGRFVARRGEGLHHVALRVDGIEAMFARLSKEGVRLASDAVRVGAGGHQYFFVHPSSTGGVLVEIVGEENAFGKAGA